LILLACLCPLQAAAKAADKSPHKVHLVTVEPGVTLEVLDWGGEGIPLVFLAGSGNTAHAFDNFAPLFIGKHHVYAITRRGFGQSSAPPPTEANYNPDRLGDDILAVIRTLRLKRPVLVGHSLAGEELSSIGTRHPNAVSGLIYLEAGYGYAYNDTATQTNVYVLGNILRGDLDNLAANETFSAVGVVRADLARLTQAAKDMQEELDGVPASDPGPDAAIYQAIWVSNRPYGPVKVPALAIFADPKKCGDTCDQTGPRASARVETAAIRAFAQGNKDARVITIPGASHFVFRSNTAQVEAEMNRFMDGLAR